MSAARHLWTLFEPLHAVTYFAPESRSAFEEAGLRGFWRGYFAGRGAPLGRTPAAVVTALYAGFAPATVERAIPAVWDLVAPERVLEVRLAGAEAALGRLLAGQETAVEEAADLLWRVAEAAPTIGRALGAANAALPRPEHPLGVLWQAATTLRELRGDGHVTAQLAVGLDGVTAMVLRAGLDPASAVPRDVLQPARGLTDEQWEAAADSLRRRSLLGADALASISGRAMLDRAEHLTDDLAEEPWEAVGTEVEQRFTEVATPLAALVRAELPAVTPIGLPAA